MMLLGKESFWLLGVAAIAFCVGIIISVDWLTNICWSIVAATIVYGVTVVLLGIQSVNIGAYFYANMSVPYWR